ncbi:MAG: viperin family antiviral radical SAM protein [Flavobacteriales bacterium]|nr:viperin family antiviral radical SAM protein [Flavobacteriales bacterium]MDW8410912.1 viperin family antiviral radical SAM protein [Flavobacteriales bacterium]
MKTTVNFHVWQPCNMRCQHCFARFLDVKQDRLPKGHLPKEEALEVVREIGRSIQGKISFAGGEPTLCPWLSDLIREAKNYGLITSIITNGTGVTEEFLIENAGVLDWIALSIDSLVPGTNEKIGRKVPGHPAPGQADYEELAFKIKRLGYKLKINTVVSSLNYQENFHEFIRKVMPDRWKIFQVLEVKGQNDREFGNMKINNTQFHEFMERHRILSLFTELAVEDNEDMRGSYLMVDPAGRFYDNIGERYRYSQPIHKVGFFEALHQVTFQEEKFIKRGGDYLWKSDPEMISVS